MTALRAWSRLFQGKFAQRPRHSSGWGCPITVTLLGAIVMGLKRFLIIGLLVIGITTAAVLLFLAGDHDEEYRNSVPPLP